jgi:uncharacterized DUF497 family protein
MLFEWDENKNRVNRVKHGIDFDLARLAFDDPLAITTQDRCVDSEQRYHLIGAVFMRIILVAHVIRAKPPTAAGEDDPVIRIISARKATPAESKLYEKNAAN